MNTFSESAPIPKEWGKVVPPKPNIIKQDPDFEIVEPVPTQRTPAEEAQLLKLITPEPAEEDELEEYQAEPTKTILKPEKFNLTQVKKNFEIMFENIEGAKPVKDLSVDRYWVPFIENYKNLGHITIKQEKDWTYEYWPDDVPKEDPEILEEELKPKKRGRPKKKVE